MNKKPTVNKTVLDNGVRIVSMRMPHVRSVSMGVWVHVGARDETDVESGLSHFIEHMIFKGTARRSAFQIAKEFDAIGGQTNAFTSMEHTCYHARVLDTQLSTMVDILSDIFLNSSFDGSEVERERPVIFQEIGMVEDTPEELVHEMMGPALWGTHPLGRSILGPRENILGFDSVAIKTFFKRLYQPDRIVIAIAGNVEHHRLVDMVAPVFSTIAGGSGFAPRAVPAAGCGIALKHRDLEQTHLCLGMNGVSVTDPRRFAASLLNTIFGGNMSSRLFQIIREERGLAYSIYSFLTSYTDTGMLGVCTAVDPKDIETSVDLIINEVRRLKRDPVPAEVLADAKEFTKGNLLMAAESPDNQMARLAQNEFYFGRTLPIQSVIDNIDAVTAPDLQALAEDLWDGGRAALTMVGPGADGTDFSGQLTL
ncbi:peptidase M16 [Desulfosarcina alkanivorans]|uniref:Peptidase M16 n=1 Tax=Desulfosarcina alkanivorans TaxID=571177 RepID=A0A5K7YJW0_9BACT|nr:pitrilysin family protein [Desulfosarcina alkanivorans]BBO69148.1 peptidase M16 [Desulfosarcina alkanivorans]